MFVARRSSLVARRSSLVARHSSLVTPLSTHTFNPVAAIMAWLWPGLGHIVLGHRRRGRLIMFGVLFLFLGGILVGGVDCIDRKQDRLWFLAQSVCGPVAFAADLVNQAYVKTRPQEQRVWMVGLNKPNEMGTLFVALAGLMNLVVILDALAFAPRPPESKPLIERRRGADAMKNSAP